MGKCKFRQIQRQMSSIQVDIKIVLSKACQTQRWIERPNGNKYNDRHTKTQIDKKIVLDTQRTPNLDKYKDRIDRLSGNKYNDGQTKKQIDTKIVVETYGTQIQTNTKTGQTDSVVTNTMIEDKDTDRHKASCRNIADPKFR